MSRPVCVECGEKAVGEYSGPCSVCKAPTCPRHTYYYVDESNIAVTRNALPKCLLHRDRNPAVPA